MVEIFILNKDLSEYFEKVISEIKAESALNDYRLAYKIAANYITSDLLGLFNGDSFSEERCLITPENFADFIILISKGEISSKIAKQILSEMFKTGKDPLHIIKDSNLSQINSEDEIEKIIKEVILENQKAVDDYKNGKESSFQFLIGKIMAKTKGRANPQLIHKILKKQLT
jgi:aspartyl-tRNA(Asn)/glutamyl-tRNA(Gln) amidotransferase subunit B